MGRMYAACWTTGTINTGIDLFEFTAPADQVVVIHEIHMGVTAVASENLRVRLVRLLPTVTPGSGGSNATSSIGKLGGVKDPTPGSTLYTLNTTAATSSVAQQVIRRTVENALNGFHWVFTPESRIVVPSSGVIVAKLNDVPAGSFTMEGEIVFEEIG